MSTILLPAVRRDTVNLYRYEIAGVSSTDADSSGTTQFGEGSGLAQSITIVRLSEVGLSVGDAVSASAEIKNATAGDRVRLEMRCRSDDLTILQTNASAYVDSQGFVRATVENRVIPSGTTLIDLWTRRETGTGLTSIRKGMVNRGATAQAFDIPKRGAWAPIVHAMLARDNDQSVQRYLSGASQITSYPSRRWMLQFATHVLEGDELREWSLALDQLSDLGNVFRFTPPEYQGPSTGYEGPMPAVNGASQTGTSLICDGVTASTDILGPGDYVSFEVTTAKSNTNVELHRIASLATSDASGNVTLTFTRPIRQAPADNAVVQIYAPTAQFRFVAPRAGTDLQLLRRTPISVEAEEAVFL